MPDADLIEVSKRRGKQAYDHTAQAQLDQRMARDLADTVAREFTDTHQSLPIACAWFDKPDSCPYSLESYLRYK
ncbi:hypothetical protein [Bradyrhizobium elkanii]|uniref:hypothetical protein n=1 Tax=Bradyrhizobium elkanii TaxID=29448 RepID=UPI001AE9601F|nr:hypothetical protein [Bradyrhizobium elkanii]MBP2434249.1 hypothetical protein [Bradyrhizobium elkanii]WLA88845.1 hypothetical protein QNJ96_27535 [Bradyrhizobium elkanii]